MTPRCPVERLNENVVEFRDDDRTGYKMRLIRANDGDFHISVVPDFRDMEDEDERERTAPCFGASVRVRMPMVGGGSHDQLYAALAKLWNKLERTPSVSSSGDPT